MFALSLSVFRHRIKLSTFILNRFRELLMYSKRCVFEPCRLIKNHTQVFMVQKSCYYRSRYADRSQSEKMECLHQRIRVLESKIKSGNTSISQIPTNYQTRELQESVIDLQCRSMKNNLIFPNLAEQPTEDVERKLRTLIFS
jgi:hypothetical protein